MKGTKHHLCDQSWSQLVPQHSLL